jgi:N-acetylglucosamine kinase-like BadF-type ATPase
MARPGHVLAVDGGNTSTIALVVERGGRVAGASRGGCSDIYGAASPAEAIAEIVGAASAALAAAGVAAGELAVAAYSLAGADWPEDFRLLEEELAAALPTVRPPLVVNDAVGALWTGPARGRGAAAVCGTYASVAAAGPAGTWHSSFWAEPAGAVHLAEAALRAACQAELGTGPATALRERIVAAGGCASVEQLLHRHTARSAPPRAEIARLAPTILDVADEGDVVARRLVAEQAEAIARSVRAGVARAGVASPHPLVLAGGLFRHRSALLAEDLGAALPDARITVSAAQPVAGVAVMAAERAGMALDAERLLGEAPGEAAIPPWRSAEAPARA